MLLWLLKLSFVNNFLFTYYTVCYNESQIYCKGNVAQKKSSLMGKPVLAHLSQRLVGELIGYPWSGVLRRPQCSNIFSETTCQIKAKFSVEPPWEGGTKLCLRHLGHMTKMAATPIYGKNASQISSPEPAGRFPRNLVCSIEDSCPS